jgi:hypothetical protein
MDRPVRGSALRGISGLNGWSGRSFAAILSRSPSVRAELSLSSVRRISSLTASGASEVVSTPPAMPTSS